jgi:hypothetical protein
MSNVISRASVHPVTDAAGRNWSAAEEDTSKLIQLPTATKLRESLSQLKIHRIDAEQPVTLRGRARIR